MIRLQRPFVWSVTALVLSVIAVTAMVLYWFDPSGQSFYPVCHFHKMTGWLCPGCGSLRALHQLFHGHFAAAFRLNPLLILSLPALLWFGVLCLKRRAGQPQANTSIRPLWLWLALGIGLAFSIWRNMPGTPFALLPH
ncbi:MAG TPA: DUF2752 domain-containing protein [Clostridia bacterium]|nr:DUF2752 domain-containing protein [Clostridia bacterium]